MMNKNYIVLLSSLIVCSSMAMDRSLWLPANEGCFSPEENLKFTGIAALMPTVGHIYNQVDENVNMLREQGALTPDTLCQNMKTILESYDEQTITEYQRVYCDIARVKYKSEGIISRFAVNKNGTQIAVIEEKCGEYPVVKIWRECSRGVWKEAKKQEFNTYHIKSVAWTADSENSLFLETMWEPYVWNIDTATLETPTNNVPVLDGNGKDLIDDNEVHYAGGGEDKGINVSQTGIMIRYRPTLKDIAEYLAHKAESK